MKQSVQAKEICKLLEIQRQRYDYLKRLFSIDADVEEGIGQGTVNRYGFKGVCEFAYAHYINLVGFPPRHIRTILEHLERLDDDKDTKEETHRKLVLDAPLGESIEWPSYLPSNYISPENRKSVGLFDPEKEIHPDYSMYAFITNVSTDAGKTWDFQRLIYTSKPMLDEFKGKVEKGDAKITVYGGTMLNLAEIKAKVLEYFTE